MSDKDDELTEDEVRESDELLEKLQAPLREVDKVFENVIDITREWFQASQTYIHRNGLIRDKRIDNITWLTGFITENLDSFTVDQLKGLFQLLIKMYESEIEHDDLKSDQVEILSELLEKWSIQKKKFTELTDE